MSFYDFSLSGYLVQNIPINRRRSWVQRKTRVLIFGCHPPMRCLRFRKIELFFMFYMRMVMGRSGCGGRLYLSGPWSINGRFSFKSWYPGSPGLQHDLCRHLYLALKKRLITGRHQTLAIKNRLARDVLRSLFDKCLNTRRSGCGEALSETDKFAFCANLNQ